MVDEKWSLALREKFDQHQREKKSPSAQWNFPSVANDDPRWAHLEATTTQWNLSPVALKKAFPHLVDEFFLQQRLHEGSVVLNHDDLEFLGLSLLPHVAYGVLNGGSATSYADEKKNKALDAELFTSFEKDFQALSKQFRNQPKGLTPAYMNPDGSWGASYLELKFRHLAVLEQRYLRTFDSAVRVAFFQMTSENTTALLNETLVAMQGNHELWWEDFFEDRLILSREQELLRAWQILPDGTTSWMRYRDSSLQERDLLLPGGHGQNFRVLREVYAALHSAGYRYIYLGNIDNLGYTINLAALALLELSSADAGFEFSSKTRFDVKGGLLVEENGRLNCLDIGGALRIEDVHQAEKDGKTLLFNCATGLFKAEALLDKLDYIIDALPLRFVEADKDIGRYWHAEQVTWEVLGLLSPLILIVEKNQRFLAAKHALEMLVSSAHDEKRIPAHWKDFYHFLHEGFLSLMKTVYKMDYDPQEKRFKESILGGSGS